MFEQIRVREGAKELVFVGIHARRGGAITDVYIHSYAEGACLDLLIITVPYNEPQPTMGNHREPHIDEIKIGFY